MSHDEGYIYIPNWTGFQHYKDQTSPAWIKCYRRLLSDDAYLALSLADRGLLLNVWLLCSDAGEGRVSADRTLLARRLNVRRVSLDSLIHAGFVTVRSRKRSDKSYRRPSAETETETEKKDISAEGSAIINNDFSGERVRAVESLVEAIGSDGDPNTAGTIHKLVMAQGLSVANIQLARERVGQADARNRAKYAVGVLLNIAKESA